MSETGRSLIDTLYWHTPQAGQGQIVTEDYPQIPGAAEGAEGPGAGLALRFDASDWTWCVSDRTLGVILRGRGDCPSVAEAIAERARVREALGLS